MPYSSLRQREIPEDKPPKGLEIKVVTGPSTEPFTTAEAKDWLRVDHSNDDDLIASIIAGVRELVEIKTRRALIEQVLQAEWRTFYHVGEVPRPNHLSIDTVWRIDEEGATELLTEGDDYYVRGLSQKEIYIPTRYKVGGTDTGREYDGLRVEFTAGYDTGKDSPSDSDYRDAIPDALKAQMRRDIATIYEHRENFVVGHTVGELPDPGVYSKWKVR